LVQVVTADISVNGYLSTIHIIDKVLIPPVMRSAETGK
jgi:uncharacterized surface protein with fasciclin (FAS1) repeats